MVHPTGLNSLVDNPEVEETTMNQVDYSLGIHRSNYSPGIGRLLTWHRSDYSPGIGHGVHPEGDEGDNAGQPKAAAQSLQPRRVGLRLEMSSFIQ